MGTSPVLTLLIRTYCHLCDDMRAALAPVAAHFGASIVEFDVDADRALEARYGEHVPVLFLGSPSDGVELCHYSFDSAVVHRALVAQSEPD